MVKKYRTKISIWRILLAILFIGGGCLPFILPTTSENNIFLKLLPMLLFGGYAAYMLLCFFTTFTLSNNTLIIKSFSGTITIPLANITAITTRKINPLFRYGYIKGYIRKETTADVILISYTDTKQKPATIMISPQNQNAFLTLLHSRTNI